MLITAYKNMHIIAYMQVININPCTVIFLSEVLLLSINYLGNLLG